MIFCAWFLMMFLRFVHLMACTSNLLLMLTSFQQYAFLFFEYHYGLMGFYLICTVTSILLMLKLASESPFELVPGCV